MPRFPILATTVATLFSLSTATHAEVDLTSGAFDLPDTGPATGWETLDFDEPFSTPPVVIVSPGASTGGQPFTVKVKDIGTTGFTLQTWEPRGESGVHRHGTARWPVHFSP